MLRTLAMNHSIRRTVLAASLLGIVFAIGIPERPAHGQEGAVRAREARAKRQGHIYIASVGAADALRGIAAIDPNDGSQRMVTDDVSQQASVSPVGKRVAVMRFSAGKVDPGLWIYDTTGERNAFRVSERRGNAVWSPDGTELLLGSGGPGGMEYWRMPADGSREERVPIPTTELILDWSPDGRWILTASTRRRSELPMYVMHPDGTGEKPLLASSNPVPEFGGNIGLRGKFSRDGRKVLFSYLVREGDIRPPVFKSAGLLLVDVNGGPTKRFLERIGGDFPTSACWSPDGKEIAVLVIDKFPVMQPGQAVQGPENRIEIVDLDGAVLDRFALPGPSIARNVLDWR